ncbi:hypothetical protein H072_4969 [Dactylellina haptotyla CBS 200.50]|uniref:Uncharacterized protein n=1 Tax=Dactylellina haptotyla (strain CBS 200.50) TaxID=1284197 RepID=S8C0I3_DACHA|nr:hypothetical protein H072_4969 [Dactylellina haptotyla CBS 200.50]
MEMSGDGQTNVSCKTSASRTSPQMMLLSLQRDSNLTWNSPRLLFLKITGNEEPATTPIEIAKTLTRLPYNIRELMLNVITTQSNVNSDRDHGELGGGDGELGGGQNHDKHTDSNGINRSKLFDIAPYALILGVILQLGIATARWIDFFKSQEVTIPATLSLASSTITDCMLFLTLLAIGKCVGDFALSQNSLEAIVISIGSISGSSRGSGSSIASSTTSSIRRRTAIPEPMERFLRGEDYCFESDLGIIAGLQILD